MRIDLTRIKIPFLVLLYSIAVACSGNNPEDGSKLWISNFTLSQNSNILVPESIVLTQTPRTFTIIKNELKQGIGLVFSKPDMKVKEVIWWCDASPLYFQTFPQKEIPSELDAPAYKLKELQQLKFDIQNHN